MQCDQIDYCTKTPDTWCLDTCEQVNYRAACQNRLNWIDQTEKPVKCQEGCCICKDPGSVLQCDKSGGGNPIKAYSDCNSYCTGFGYSLYMFDTSIFEADQCKNICTGSATLNSGDISGYIKTVSGSFISGATVKSLGISADSNNVGFYTLTGLPIGSNQLSVEKSGYRTAYINVVLGTENKEINV